MAAADDGERDRLEAELYALGFNVGLPTAEAMAARNRRIDELQSALAKLPPRRVVGTRERPPLPPGWELPEDEDDTRWYDPFLASPTARRDER